MSEIEKIKLYQNAGIEPTYTDECIIANRYWEDEELANEYGTFDKFMEKNCEFGYQECTDECEYAYDNVSYPPFTAEKQIELIKWLSDTDYFIHNIYKTIDTKEYFIDNYYHDMQTDKFEETLAGLINKLWQDLTEEEKEALRGILRT